MHNIRTNVSKLYRICRELFEQEVDNRKSFQFYLVAPKMHDLEVVALSCCMEALSIDPENLLWSKPKTDCSTLFPHLMDRSRFNRRRRRITFYIHKVQQSIAEKLREHTNSLVIDSIPVPVVKMARERSWKAF